MSPWSVWNQYLAYRGGLGGLLFTCLVGRDYSASNPAKGHSRKSVLCPDTLVSAVFCRSPAKHSSDRVFADGVICLVSDGCGSCDTRHSVLVVLHPDFRMASRTTDQSSELHGAS